ncbi:hypothetical protein [Photobacterium aquimaris]|nr:hypothetical protein [Photobacterium aquimaris]
MTTVKRREVKIPFAKNERNGFISMAAARKRRNLDKFKDNSK